MIRRPPRSTRTDTLFPYTTLFRSLAQQVAKRRIRPDGGAALPYALHGVVGSLMQRVGVAPALEGFSLAGRAFARLHSQQPLLRGIAGFGGAAAAIHRIHPCTYGHVDASASQIPDLSHSPVTARSGKRSVGKECVSTCRTWRSPYQ